MKIIDEEKEKNWIKPSFALVMGWIQVGGLCGCTLLLGHGHEWGHHVGLQGVRCVLVGPVDDSFAGFQKNNSLRGWRGKRFINRCVVSSLGMSANLVTMEAFSELLW